MSTTVPVPASPAFRTVATAAADLAALAAGVPDVVSPVCSAEAARIDLAPHRSLVEPEGGLPVDTRRWLVSAAPGARIARRALDTIPAALTWLIVLSPFWAGYFLPLPLALAIVGFDCYWVYLSVSTALLGYKSHRRMMDDSSEDWPKLYRAARLFHRTYMDWDDVRHVVIVPNYRESETILARTIESLAAQENADQVHIVLAMEERDANHEQKARRLLMRYGASVGSISYTVHPAGLPGEVAGKSANEAWAARWVRKSLVDEKGWDIYATTVTSCDADTVFHPRYFSCLTYKFATDPHRYRRFWQSPILLNNNIWDSPAPLRVASALQGVHMLSNLLRRNRVMFPQSTYSLSLKMADDAGYWDPEVIPEDWHMYLKCFFAFRGEVEVEPIFLPTGNDAILSTSYSASLKMAYAQHKRHAWGASDISYAIVQSVGHAEIPLRRRARQFAALLGNHLIWSTHWFILSLGWFMPHVIGQLFGPGHAPVWLPLTARGLLWLCLVPFISMFFLDRRLRPQKPPGWRWWQTAADLTWWVLLPISSFIFSTLPALDAQTRLALGKRLEYLVTDKKAPTSVNPMTVRV